MDVGVVYGQDECRTGRKQERITDRMNAGRDGCRIV